MFDLDPMISRRNSQEARFLIWVLYVATLFAAFRELPQAKWAITFGLLFIRELVQWAAFRQQRQHAREMRWIWAQAHGTRLGTWDLITEREAGYIPDRSLMWDEPHREAMRQIELEDGDWAEGRALDNLVWTGRIVNFFKLLRRSRIVRMLLMVGVAVAVAQVA